MDFRVNTNLAVGHDSLNTIIFQALEKLNPSPNYPRWDGQAWRTRRFVYRDKLVLLRDLRDLGATEAELEHTALAILPDDLRYQPGRVAG